ncbi:MAG: DUF1015 family protein [Bacteroidales bacterium]|nr:DUF1015 family protein [Bacteroidales bacterium]MDD2324372.1 DUF1015 family protein [Bacteroidales bacterium]MDD3012053.1 DUF1015 family protein [Bacteroidales bacterium]MDD3961154.1 DUF1015 family protein [Bacteroidales bacterium]MDY0286959.1 DUF1015 family protein [Bacteroidales bacterium]
MAIIKPFKGVRPPMDLAEKVASRPYDVLNSEEARREASGNPYSLLHITKAEIDLEPGIDEHTEPVYQKSVDNYKLFKANKWLVKDETEMYYIYAQTMNGRTQYGLVAAASTADYLKGVIKKHELTRSEKEEDRMINVRRNNANIEPVFFTYPANDKIDTIVNSIIRDEEPVYDFTAEDGFGHHFWLINRQETIAEITRIFSDEIPCTYVADGHHRTAAAARVGLEKKEQNPNHTGEEEYNYFLAVHFPDDQLQIIDYNRVVKDLNGMTPDELIAKLSESFMVEMKGAGPYKPEALHVFSMYLGGKWYKMTAKEGTYNDNDPIGVLDVTILSNLVLDKLLNIKDLRTSKRIDFVGGIRGLGELSKRVDSGEMKVAFALYPVSMQQLIDIADTGNIMPPKTTWFEPKLRSGLVIHELE